jgi:hypothetical protein
MSVDMPLPPGAEGYPIKTRKITLDDLPAKPNGASANDTSAPRLEFKTLASFCREYVPLAYAIEPILRASSLYTLTARTGHGKTAFLVVAALAIATGRKDIIGLEASRGRVAFLTFENPDDARMRAPNPRKCSKSLLLSQRPSPSASLSWIHSRPSLMATIQTTQNKVASLCGDYGRSPNSKASPPFS